MTFQALSPPVLLFTTKYIHVGHRTLAKTLHELNAVGPVYLLLLLPVLHVPSPDTRLTQALSSLAHC